MELETLALSVEDAYGIYLSGVWRDDITLGELFSVVQQTKPHTHI